MMNQKEIMNQKKSNYKFIIEIVAQESKKFENIPLLREFKGSTCYKNANTQFIAPGSEYSKKENLKQLSSLVQNFNCFTHCV